MAKITFSPLNFLILPVSWLIVLTISDGWINYLLCTMVCIINLLVLTRFNLNWKKLGYFSLTLIPALAATYLTGYFFTIRNNSAEVTTLNLCIRLYGIAMISFMYVNHMPREKIMLELMQRKLLSVNIGFGLLATLNAFSYFAQEFKRIQLAYQMRFQKKCYSPKIIFPLLVAAARYSHNLSISMFNRGLNPHRNYINNIVPVAYPDYILWIANLSIIAIIYYFS